MPASASVTPFAAMSGISPFQNPYTSRSFSLVTRTRNILIEMSCVDRVRHTCRTWGIYAPVLYMAAA